MVQAAYDSVATILEWWTCNFWLITITYYKNLTWAHVLSAYLRQFQVGIVSNDKAAIDII